MLSQRDCKLTDDSRSNLSGAVKPIFPPGYGYPSLKDWEHKHQDEMRFQRWMRLVRRGLAVLKGNYQAPINKGD